MTYSACFNNLMTAYLPSPPLLGTSGEMQSLLSSFGADISKSLQAKRKRMENFAQVALKTSSKKVGELWQSQHSER